jgi:transposase InsO family protein
MVVDQYFKWLVAVPLKDKRGETVAYALEHRVLPLFPEFPERILSDNGPEFRSTKFNEALNNSGIDHLCSTPYQPSFNGEVERVNRPVAEMLRTTSLTIAGA